ncbi:MAG: hypothetical protein V7752_19580 [Halopseudomonas sp.]
MEETLEQEATSIEHLLKGKPVSRIFRPSANEVCIEFNDGTRFFIDNQNKDDLGFSVTGGSNE